MSLMLKGIDMPSEEEGLKVICLFPHGAEELVVIDADSGATAGRPIQAIQIPKDHGRLIDADKFIDDLKYDADMDMTRFITDGDEEARYDAECKENCISFIESSATPTILEAEEET